MLADEVIAYPSQPEFAKLVPFQRIGYAALAEEVLRAERFVLQRDAVFLIHSVSNVPPSRLVPALQICRMPFPRMWVEFVYKDRDDWHAWSKVERESYADSSAPARLGFYLEQKDESGRAIDVTVVWRHNNDPNFGGRAIVIGGYSMHLNTQEGVTVSDATRAHYAHALAHPTEMDIKFGANKRYSDPRDNEAAMEMEERISVDFSLYMAPFWEWIQKNHPEEEASLRERALFDLLQEWRFILGLLMVLNSRNLIEYSAPIVFDKLNKARKAKGAPPLHAHREIRLGLSLVQRNRLGGGRTSDLMAHLVRGHFKVRRTGLFWWSPHVRGKGEPPTGRPYIVKAPTRGHG